MADGIALVTVTYNSADDLRQSWARFDRSLEWIVVDNRSTDDSADAARSFGARVIESGENRGFSYANNLAAQESTADVLIFVNPDVTVDRDGIERLARLCTALDGIVAPQLLNPDGSPQENGRQAPYLYRKVAHFVGSEESRRSYEVTAAPGEIKRIAWAIGAAVAVPRHVFERIGGWDAGFFIYYEDSEICLRAREQGYPVVLTGDVRWPHGWQRATRRTFRWRVWKMEIRSMLRFYSRYPRLLLHPWLAGGREYAKDVAGSVADPCSTS